MQKNTDLGDNFLLFDDFQSGNNFLMSDHTFELSLQEAAFPSQQTVHAMPRRHQATCKALDYSICTKTLTLVVATLDSEKDPAIRGRWVVTVSGPHHRHRLPGLVELCDHGAALALHKNWGFVVYVSYGYAERTRTIYFILFFLVPAKLMFLSGG